MTEYIQVVTTVDSEEEVQGLARALVEKHLAACVQVLGPVKSTYWWEAKIETGQEWQCIAKTRNDLYPQVEQTINQIHSYEVPEILAMPILAGAPGYLDWLDRELKARESA